MIILDYRDTRPLYEQIVDAELERQGYIYSVKGKGSFVADSSHIRENEKLEILKEQKALAEKAARLGVEREKMKTAIDEIYDKEGQDK